MKELKKDDIVLSLAFALIGEIYPSIRAIVYEYKAKSRDFNLRCYLDREVEEDDIENMSYVVGEFWCDYHFHDFNSLDSECVYTTQPLSALDILDGIVYCRKE